MGNEFFEKELIESISYFLLNPEELPDDNGK